MIEYENSAVEDQYLSSEELQYPEEEQSILRALRYLAECCDNAEERDHKGFSRFDAEFGKSLAFAGRSWTGKQLLGAAKIAGKYARTQLTPAGFLLPDESAVQALARRKEMEYTARQQRYDNAPRQATSTNQARIIGLRDGMIGVMFPNRCSDFQENLGKIYAIEAEVAGARLAFRPDLPEVKFVEAPGKRSGETKRFWQVPLEYAEQVIKSFPTFHVLPEVLEIVNAERRRIEEKRRAADEKARKGKERVEKLLNAVGSLDEPVGGRTLYEHQKEAVRTMIEWDGGIIAYDQGTGKTIIGCMIALAYKKMEDCRVIVAGPKTMRGAWIEEAGRVGVPIEYFTHDSIPADFPGKYIVIVDECDAYQNMRAHRTKKFIALAWKALACFPMSGTPARNGRPDGIYPALLAVKNPAVYAELSDGTPCPDTIKKLRRKYEARYCAAQATEHSAWDTTGTAFLTEFHEKFVGTPRGILRKLIDDCLDLPEKVRTLVPVELNTEETKTYQAAIAKMWDEHQTRVAEKIEKFKNESLPKKLEGEVTRWLCKQLDKKTIDMTDPAVLDLAQEIAAFRAKTTTLLLKEEQDRLAQGDALVSMGHFRHTGSRAKARVTIEATWKIFEEDAEEALEAEREGREHKPAAVVIFCEFKDVAQQIADAFDVPVMSGDVPQKKRDAMIEAFQNGEHRVFVSIYGAGGVGITLTAAAHIFLVGRPMTPGAAFQAEARIRRIGQTRTCLSLWLQIPAGINPVDGRIDEMLQRKQKNIATMLDGATEESQVNALEFTNKEVFDLFYEATHFQAAREVEVEA